MATIGTVTIPQYTPAAVFPLTKIEYGFGVSQAPQVVTHVFTSANRKISQRFLLGNGARRFQIGKSYLTDDERLALVSFWETMGGAHKPFWFDAPNEDGTTTRYTVCFESPELSLESFADGLTSTGIVLVEDPSVTPSYTIARTVNRFPDVSLSLGLLGQAQQMFPLVKIVPTDPGYPAIYLSDRKVTVGGQTYEPRLVNWDGISQSIGEESDEASFTLGNADRVFTQVVNSTDLFKARIEFSLFHVGTMSKLDLWAGDVTDWSFDSGNEFHLKASDGLYELRLGYPVNKINRTCWKQYGVNCPDKGGSCNKSWDNCVSLGNQDHFGGINAKPQTIQSKDNSTGTWGIGRDTITSRSLISDSMYGQVLPEIYTAPGSKTTTRTVKTPIQNPDGSTDWEMDTVEEVVDSFLPVNCLLAAGRDEGDFYAALGVVGQGPLGQFGSGHTLDGQSHHGPGNMGLRQSLGNDPNPDSFSLSESDKGVLKPLGPERAAGTAFIEIRRQDEKGLQLSKITEHTMQAMVRNGLKGYVWSGPGARDLVNLTNPVWIAINILLKARNKWNAAIADQEALFDVPAAVAAGGICDLQVAKMVGEGTQKQYAFRGVLAEEKPLRDWMTEVLNTCLGYFLFNFGKLKIGLRAHSGSASAFTEGNIVADTLSLAPLKPSFNHLTVNFGDEQYDFSNNAVSVYDVDYARRIGGTTAPLYLKSNLNLVGVSNKSHAGRIAATRLKEELGGVTPAEWDAARRLSFRTTVLALETEPGMICSLTHPDMPNGSGEFRILRWKLNRDFSIDIEGRTTTDSMYDLVAGPKPVDVDAEPIPVEEVDNIPGDVIDFIVTASVFNDSNTVKQIALDIEYTPPVPLGSFTSVGACVEFPDGKVTEQKYFQFVPDANGKGHCRLFVAPPMAIEDWIVYLSGASQVFRNILIRVPAPEGVTPTPNKTVTVDPVDPIGLGPQIADVTNIQVQSIEAIEQDGQLKSQITLTYAAPAELGTGDAEFSGVEADLFQFDVRYPQGWHLYRGVGGGQGTVVLVLPFPSSDRDWLIYLRARSDKWENSLVEAGEPGETPHISVHIDTSAVEVPDVLSFHAGTYNPTTQQWTATMSWAKDKLGLTVDWGCVLPASLINWSAVSVYAKVPDGQGGLSYVEMTGRAPKGNFTDSDGVKSTFETILIELQSIPAVPESWTFIACSRDRAGNPKLDTSGNPTGPFITLQTLEPPIAPKVSSATAEVFYEDTETATAGVFGIRGTFAVPASEHFHFARIMFVYPPAAFEHGPIEEQDGDFQAGGVADGWPTPSSPTAVQVRIYSVNHEGEVNPDFFLIDGLTINPNGELKFEKLTIPPDGIKLEHLDTLNIHLNDFAGSLSIEKVENLQSIAITEFAGQLPIGRVNDLGSINITTFQGNLPIERIDNIGNIDIGSLSGSLSAAQAAQISINSFEGVLVTEKLANGILNDLNKFAADFRPITRVASLPGLPNAAYPVGTIVLLTSNSTLYKNANNTTWSPVSASETITGKIADGDILSISAGKLNGQINAANVTHIAISQFAGTLSTTQCGSISIGSFAGNLDVSRIARLDELNINTFSGSIDEINATTVTLTGKWQDGHIEGISAGKLTAGEVNATITMTSPDIRASTGAYTVKLNTQTGFSVEQNSSPSTIYTDIQPTQISVNNRSSAQTYSVVQPGRVFGQYHGSSSRFEILANSAGASAQFTTNGGVVHTRIDPTYIKVPSIRQPYQAEVIALGGLSTVGWVTCYDSNGNYKGKIPVIP